MFYYYFSRPSKKLSHHHRGKFQLQLSLSPEAAARQPAKRRGSSRHIFLGFGLR